MENLRAGINKFLASELLNIWVTRLGAMCASWFGSQWCFLQHVHRPVILHINTGHILLIPHLHQSHLVLSEELPILATTQIGFSSELVDAVIDQVHSSQ